MTTDFRALCAELTDELEGWVAYGDEIDIANAHVLIDRARAALAEPQPEPPTDGEVAELVAALHQISDGASACDDERASWITARAAELLQRLHPQPVPVSERLPGPEDCDAEGRCWWGEPQIGDSHDATWTLCTHEDAQEFLTRGINGGWLPAHALPVPQ